MYLKAHSWLGINIFLKVLLLCYTCLLRSFSIATDFCGVLILLQQFQKCDLFVSRDYHRLIYKAGENIQTYFISQKSATFDQVFFKKSYRLMRFNWRITFSLFLCWVFFASLTRKGLFEISQLVCCIKWYNVAKTMQQCMEQYFLLLAAGI